MPRFINDYRSRRLLQFANDPVKYHRARHHLLRQYGALKSLRELDQDLGAEFEEQEFSRVRPDGSLSPVPPRLR
jgi:hypothetical protein